MLPWEEIENIYNTKLNNTHKGARNKPARVIIGALLIKPKSIKKKWRKILEKEMKQKPRLEQGKDFIELIILEQNCLILELHGSALVIL